MAIKGEPKTAQIGAPVQGVGKVRGISGFVLRGVDARCSFGDLSYLYPVMVESIWHGTNAAGSRPKSSEMVRRWLP